MVSKSELVTWRQPRPATLRLPGTESQQLTPSPAVLSAFHYVFAVAALIAFLGMLRSLTLRDADAAATLPAAARAGPEPRSMPRADAAELRAGVEI